MDWEVIAGKPHAAIRRHGRFIVADLLVPHVVFSTSARNGGQTTHLRHLVNHQGCEPAGHERLETDIHRLGEDAYHDAICREIGLPPHESALMTTAANMNYAAVVTREDADVELTAIVTAGVETNATCAGDPAAWRESFAPDAKPLAKSGTINTILLVNRPVTIAALTRTIVTMTEAKSAALQRLAVPSRYSADLATGTGTDQFCLAAPQSGAPPFTTASPHSKFGELIGAIVRDATLEALRWQNGLEPSMTRGLFHALRRYGVSEAGLMDALAALLEPSDFELLRRNSNAVFYEPLVGAAAHGFASVLDRIRHGTLPPSVSQDALIQQAAMLAANLAAKPNRWPEFRVRLRATEKTEPPMLIAAAIALGWSDKWRET
jgi:adenosylcobinamide amidohydrolase